MQYQFLPKIIAFLARLCYNFSMIIHAEIDYDYLKTNSAVPDDINYQPHFHSTYEMLYTLNIGEAYYNISASKFRIGIKDLIIIQPGTLHNLQIIPGQEYERIVMYFSKENIHSDLHDFLQTTNKIYHLQDDSPIQTAFSLLRENSKVFSKEEFSRTLEGLLNMIITHLKYSHEEKKTESLNAQNETINKILNYIEENITQPLNADNISEKFFVSKSWLSHNFKKHLNISLKKYINQKKLLHIERLISAGITISKAVESCSFANYATFFRQYKQYANKKPTDNKKTVRDVH